jgi:uncharacterized integral membrane protein (TIGR00697 family)
LISASEVLIPVGGFQTWLVEGFGFLGESNLRIFAASFTAIIIAESLDTEIYHKVLKHRWFWRVCRSNSISVPTDTVLFNGIAFLGIFGWPLLLAMTATEIFVKWGVGLIYALFRGEPDEGAAASWAETVSRNPQD